MRANELRIGNLISKHVRAAPEPLTIEDYQDRLFGSKLLDGSYQPVPLTEKWLGVMGFERQGHNKWSCPTFSLVKESNGGDGFRVYKYAGPHDQFYQLLSGVKYVHQVQNLYFALTARELKVKVAL